MSTKVANLTGYITDCDGGEGFAADSERIQQKHYTVMSVSFILKSVSRRIKVF